jgi:hypothetical protein
MLFKEIIAVLTIVRNQQINYVNKIKSFNMLPKIIAL